MDVYQKTMLQCGRAQHHSVPLAILEPNGKHQAASFGMVTRSHTDWFFYPGWKTVSKRKELETLRIYFCITDVL